MVGEEDEGAGGAVGGVEVEGMVVAGLEQPVSAARRPWIDSWGRRRLRQSRSTSMSVDQAMPQR